MTSNQKGKLKQTNEQPTNSNSKEEKNWLKAPHIKKRKQTPLKKIHNRS